MINKITSLFFLIICLSAYSQPELPVDYKLDTSEDYKMQEELVKESLIWLLDQPLNEDLNKRNELNAFIMIWLSGSPEIILEIDTLGMPFLNSNQDLFFTFIQGISLYKINHKQENDPIVLHAMGLNAVARQIENSGDHVKKDKEIKKILKAYRRGNMNSYVRDLLNEEK